MSALFEPGDTIRPGNPPMVSRYSFGRRLNHWITAITMLLLVFSGLAMFHPSLFFLTAIFGGGQNTRALHPWFGVVLVASFVLLFLQFWRANVWTRGDLDWVAHIGDLVAGLEEKMPEAGKYNAGQKFIFWAMALLILALFVSGIVTWDEYFGGLTTVEVKRMAVLSHAVLAVLAILTLVLHVYAAIWVRGSFDAMIRGWVSAGWAWRHHRQWFKALAGRSEPAE